MWKTYFIKKKSWLVENFLDQEKSFFVKNLRYWEIYLIKEKYVLMENSLD